MTTILFGNDFAHQDLIETLRRRGFSVAVLDPSITPDQFQPKLVLLTTRLLDAFGGFESLRKACGPLVYFIAEQDIANADAYVGPGWPSDLTFRAIETGIKHTGLLVRQRMLEHALDLERNQLMQLTEIGIALSAETNLSNLLERILTECRRLASCDAASLFLIERAATGHADLVFKLTQNDSITVPFQERRFPLDRNSLAGYVALTGKVLNIDDVHAPQQNAQWRFNSSFDKEMGYHTRSMLIIPMRNHQQDVIGVLQFINRKRDRSIRLIDRDTTIRETLSFDRDTESLLRALASQAAVAIDNSILIRNIQTLFEGFVSAAVTAIEQRDPTTSGHSFRVAELTTGLARSLTQSDDTRYRDIVFSRDEIKELRYASLLHDFGKVGVREHVLVKADKLPKGGLESLWFRFELLKEQLRRKAAEERLQAALREGPDGYTRAHQRIQRQLDEDLDRLQTYFAEIATANKPSVLPEERVHNLESIRDAPSFDVNGRELRLLTDSEFMSLSVRKGSLTPDERLEIESHVVHTFEFLKRIPWTTHLENIPAIAVSHHEKLDGSGYPHGLKASEIPLGSKMMTVADIYDALTASDRPYKAAMPPQRALAILNDESREGLLDEGLVSIFIQSKAYASVDPNWGRSVARPDHDHDLPHRDVCDYDFEGRFEE